MLGVDYNLTFAAVIDIRTVKVVLAFATIWGVPDKHGDIPNAYAKTDKEPQLNIHSSVPRGNDISGDALLEIGAANSGEVVLELRKSLYSLKQARCL